MPVCSYIMHMYMCTYLSVYTWLADLCIYYICIGEKRHCYGTGVFEYDVSLNLSMCLAEDRRSISASLRSYHQGKSWPMTAHVIEWEKAGWEGTCKINYSSPSSANEEQEAQSSWVILVKIPELDLGKVIRLCSFCSQECPPGVTVGVCRVSVFTSVLSPRPSLLSWVVLLSAHLPSGPRLPTGHLSQVFHPSLDLLHCHASALESLIAVGLWFLGFLSHPVKWEALSTVSSFLRPSLSLPVLPISLQVFTILPYKYCWDSSSLFWPFMTFSQGFITPCPG